RRRSPAGHIILSDDLSALLQSLKPSLTPGPFADGERNAAAELDLYFVSYLKARLRPNREVMHGD
ncbi:MAG: hypothetical protein ACYC4U_30290, partial [Pirellulaceae bacterium]